MRKYFLLVSLFSNFYALSVAQMLNREIIIRHEIDSLKTILAGLKDSARVDCLNMLAHKYLWLPLTHTQKADSSSPFTKLAIEVAKQIGYKKGLGFAYLRLADYEYLKAEQYYWDKDEIDTLHIVKGEKFSREAIKIGEEINDNVILGGGWWNMGALIEMRYWNTPQSKWKPEIDLYESYLKKAISYHEKDGIELQKSKFTEQGFVNCKGCKGNERWLGGLYRDLSRIYSQLKMDHSKAIEYAKISVSYFEKAGEDELLGNVYENLSLSNSIEGNKNPKKWNEAIDFSKKAIYYYQKAGGNEKNIAQAYNRLSQIYFRINDFEPAIEFSKKAITEFKKLGDEKSEHRLCQTLAFQYITTGDFENGFKYCERSIQLAENIAKKETPNDLKNINSGQSFLFMARLYKAAGDYETAMNFTRKAYQYFPTDSMSLSFWSIEIGDLFRLMGKYDSAMHHLAPFETRPLFAANGKTNLSSLYISQKQYTKALPLIKAAINRSKEINDIAGLGIGLTLAAEAHLELKDYRTALKYAKEGLINLKTSQRKLKLIDTYNLLSQIYHNLGKNDSAYYYMRQYTNLKDSLLNRQFYWRLNSYKKEAEDERKTSQINLLNKNNQLKEQKLKQESFVKNSLVAGILLLFLLGVFIFRNLLLKRKSERIRMQKNFEIHQLESEKKQVELEMQALRAQMNPHFIFNCLSSINRFILKNESKIASNYLTRFSRLMRLVLMNSQKPLITLEDELQMLGLYLEMERLRFKNSFDYSITFLNVIESDNIFIPPLMFQPFCENAIWHGLMHKEGQGRLDIELSMQDNILNCTITDNGVGREKAEEMNSKTAEKEKSMGLKITTERLALLNKEKGLHTFYEIEDLKDENGNAAGTRIILKISFKESVEEAV